MIKLTVPSANNKVFRNGFIRLSAFESEWQSAADEDAAHDKLSDMLKQTARIKTEDFTSGGEAYLNNTIKNMRVQRSDFPTKSRFMCILPTPLSISNTTNIQWNAMNSNFIDAHYGHLKNVGSQDALNFVTNMADKAKNIAPVDALKNKLAGIEHYSNLASKQLKSGNFAMGVLAGDYELNKALRDSPAMADVVNPTKMSKMMMGAQSSASMYALQAESRALNGARQIVFDPGYWQNFQGVDLRAFNLTWEIIPETRDEAVKCLELCSRIREFSLPQSVSGVELLSPCYWQLDWSSKFLQTQTLYSHLVITSVNAQYAEQGEWHLEGTPKKIVLTINFEEAKASTADIYKSDIKVALWRRIMSEGNPANTNNTTADANAVI